MKSKLLIPLLILYNLRVSLKDSKGNPSIVKHMILGILGGIIFSIFLLLLYPDKLISLFGNGFTCTNAYKSLYHCFSFYQIGTIFYSIIVWGVLGLLIGVVRKIVLLLRKLVK